LAIEGFQGIQVQFLI